MPADGASTATPTDAARRSQNRFGARWLLYLKALLGTPSQRRLAQAALQINHIRHWEKEWSKHSDEELMKHARQLKGRARGGESLDSLLPEVFGMASVASIRATKLR